MEPGLIALISFVILLVLIFAVAVWVWSGVLLAQRKGQPYAATRWHWYVRAKRRLDRRRASKLQSHPDAPPPVTLGIHSAAHRHRVKYSWRRARDKRDQ